MYEYLPIEQAQPGDIVECITEGGVSFKKDSLHIVKDIKNHKNTETKIVVQDGCILRQSYFKLIKTKPATEAQEGDIVIKIKSPFAGMKIGDTATTLKVGSDTFALKEFYGPHYKTCFKVLCKSEQNVSEQDPNGPEKGFNYSQEYYEYWEELFQLGIKLQYSDKRNRENGTWHDYSNTSTFCSPLYWFKEEPNWKVRFKLKESEQTQLLAFYKRSNKPWTEEEYQKIRNYVKASHSNPTLKGLQRKWIFANSGNPCAYHHWRLQENHENFSNCKQVAYEDIFFSEEFQSFTVPYPESTPRRQTTQQKETPMKTEKLDIELKVNGKVVAEATKEEKPKTDLEQASKTISMVYNPDGSFCCSKNLSIKQAKKYLQSPENLGKTVIVYGDKKKPVTRLTTNVPVIEL